MSGIKVNKSKRNLSKDELDALSKEELVEMIIKIEAHNKQLKNLLEKKVKTKSDESKKNSFARGFDFTKSFKRHILLKFCYVGWDYDGYVIQEHTTETIEYHLFEALKKVCLIETREVNKYHGPIS